MTSTALAEALRTEIRTILDANGQPFTVAVARRVYDFAVAAKDLLVAGGVTVADAIEQVADTNGPLDSLTSPNNDPTPSMAAESFGVRLVREILAALPTLVRSKPDLPLAVDEGPNEWLPALILARRSGMTDVAAEIEQRMFGRSLDGPRPIGVLSTKQGDRCICPYVLQPTGALSTHLDDCPEHTP